MTSEVRLSRGLVDEMVAHCEAGRPNEACGMLASDNGEVVKVFRMTNIEASPVRYRLDSRELGAVYNTLEQKGWEHAGTFHSHTHTHAYPSATDVREAVGEVPYVIVSLAENPPVIRAFCILKEELGAQDGDIVEVPVTITG